MRMCQSVYPQCVALIPVDYRPALREVLDELTSGRRPELLTWVNAYGSRGATLVQQPDAIWEHARSGFLLRVDGSASAAMPLWTTEESPSDLSVECEISPSGVASVVDLHVL